MTDTTSTTTAAPDTSAYGVPDDVAASVLRYAEVLASEWDNMRGWLAAGRDRAPDGGGFGVVRRRRPLALPAAAPSPSGGVPPLPAVFAAETVAENLALARDALYRVRIAPAPLDDATPAACAALVTSPYVADPEGEGPVLLAPDDDEPGRMMARAVTWLPDLPQGWATSDARFEAFGALTDDALTRLAADPELLRLLGSVVSTVIVVDHPTQRAGVCSASLTHLWVSAAVVTDAAELADVLRGGTIHNALYFDELVHAKWAVDPAPLDDTKVHAPLPSFPGPMEYDTAFQAAHIEYVRLRAALIDGDAAAVSGFAAVRAVVAELLEHPDYLTAHGRDLLADLDGLAASAAGQGTRRDVRDAAREAPGRP